MDFPKKFVGMLYSERSAVVHTEKNSVIKTDHGKFLLVIKKTDSQVICCSINSNRYRFKPDGSQPEILQNQNTFLKHNSFVDCAQVFTIELDSFFKNMRLQIFEPVGFLDQDSMSRVLTAGQNCRMLKTFEKEFFK